MSRSSTVSPSSQRSRVESISSQPVPPTQSTTTSELRKSLKELVQRELYTPQERDEVRTLEEEYNRISELVNRTSKRTEKIREKLEKLNYYMVPLFAIMITWMVILIFLDIQAKPLSTKH